MCVELPATSYYNNTLDAGLYAVPSNQCSFLQQLGWSLIICYYRSYPIQIQARMSHHGTVKLLAPNQYFSAKQYTYIDHQGNLVSDWSSQCLGTVRSSLREHVKFSFQRNMFSFPDKLFCEWLQRLSPSRYLLPFPYRLFVSHPPNSCSFSPSEGNLLQDFGSWRKGSSSV